MRTVRSALVGAAATLLVLLGSAGSAGAASATYATTRGARWLTSQISSQGTLPTGYGIGDVAQSVEALDAAGDTSTTQYQAALQYLEANENLYIDGTASPSSSNDDAGALAELILVAHATGQQDAFGSSTLLHRLLATQRTTGKNHGLFGQSDPTYNGTYRQALALEALEVSDESSDPAVQSGLSWLESQQCADGGFSSYAAKVSCSGSAALYEGPDTNSTAAALTALAALDQPSGVGTPTAKALAFLRSVQRPSAGWGYYPGNSADSNSTAVVLLALRAQGQSLTSGTARWSKHGSTLISAEEGFQVGGSGASSGGFLYQASSHKPDPLSTEQAVLALSGATLPL